MDRSCTGLEDKCLLLIATQTDRSANTNQKEAASESLQETLKAASSLLQLHSLFLKLRENADLPNESTGLSLPKRSIKTILSQQFFMTTLLDDLAIFHDDQAVHTGNG